MVINLKTPNTILIEKGEMLVQFTAYLGITGYPTVAFLAKLQLPCTYCWLSQCLGNGVLS